MCLFPCSSNRINSASGCAEIQVDDSLGKALGHSNELEKRACSLRFDLSLWNRSTQTYPVCEAQHLQALPSVFIQLDEHVAVAACVRAKVHFQKAMKGIGDINRPGLSEQSHPEPSGPSMHAMTRGARGETHNKEIHDAPSGGLHKAEGSLLVEIVELHRHTAQTHKYIASGLNQLLLSMEFAQHMFCL